MPTTVCNETMEIALSQVQTVAKALKSVVLSHSQPWVRKGATVLIIGCGLLAFRWVALSTRARNMCLPPPFVGVPYFGSLFTMMYLKQDFVLKYLPQKGPICSYHIGNQTFVTLNDAKLVQAVFKHECSVNRPSKLRSGASTNHLAFASVDEYWLDRRKLIMNAITRVANRNFMDKQIKYLCQKFVFPNIDQLQGINRGYGETPWRLWYCKDDLHNCSFNMIFGSLFGIKEQLGKNNKIYKLFDDSLTQTTQKFALTFLSRILSLPIVNNIFQSQYAKHEIKQCEIATDYVNKHIDAFKTAVQDENTILDEMYQEMTNSKSNKYDFYLKDNKKVLIADVMALIGAGIETTALALECSIIYLGKFGEIQESICNELMQHIDNNIDNNTNSGNCNFQRHFLALNKILKCVLFRAFVHETLRMITPSDKGVPHQLTRPCHVSFDSYVLNPTDSCKLYFLLMYKRNMQ